MRRDESTRAGVDFLFLEKILYFFPDGMKLDPENGTTYWGITMLTDKVKAERRS